MPAPTGSCLLMLRGHSDRHAFALSRLQKKKDEFLHQFCYQLHFFSLSNQFCLYIHVTELPQTHTQATYNPLAYLLEYHHTLSPTRNPLICFLTNFLSSCIHSPSLCPGNNPFLLKQYTDCLAALCLWSGAGEPHTPCIMTVTILLRVNINIHCRKWGFLLLSIDLLQ